MNVRAAAGRVVAAGRRHPTVVIALAVAVEVRIIVLVGSLGALDGDEAVVGLMARHVLDGRFDTFYWGQSYGGTIEQLLTAGAFAVAGASTLVLKLVPLSLCAAAAVLIWRIGRRTIGEAAAPVAAAAFLVWPATYLWWSTKSRGFYWAGLVLGLVVVLCALRIAQRTTGSTRWDWLALGLAAGLGWWSTPQIVFYVVPAGLWLLVTRPRAVLGVVYALPAAVLGAAPWLVWNLDHDFRSLEAQNPDGKGYVDHLHSIAFDSTPMMLGLKVPYAHTWFWEPWGAVAAWAMVTALAVAGIAGLVRGRRTLLPLLGVVAFPFLEAFLPSASVVAEGRYLLFAVPFVVLLVAAHVRHQVVAAAVLIPLVALTVVGIDRMEGDQTYPYSSGRTIPESIDPLLDLLDDHDVDHLFADYWIAYRVTFESGEDVVATPTQALFVRHRPSDRAVRRDDAPAWAFLADTRADQTFGTDLAQLRIPAERYESDGFALYLPSERVLPADLPPHAEGPQVVLGQ